MPYVCLDLADLARWRAAPLIAAAPSEQDQARQCYALRRQIEEINAIWEGDNGTVLAGMLFIAIQQELIRLLDQGGPWDRDWEAARAYADDLGAHGDILLHKSKKRGETARLFARLACAVACGAFLPGGIATCGFRWIAAVEETDLRTALALIGVPPSGGVFYG